MPTQARKAIMIDIGGVLIPDCLPTAAAEWSTRLGISRPAFLGALFGGSDDQVLIGRVSEPVWWGIVAGRLHASPDLIAELQRDLASRQEWDHVLVAFLPPPRPGQDGHRQQHMAPDARRNGPCRVAGRRGPDRLVLRSRIGQTRCRQHEIDQCVEAVEELGTTLSPWEALMGWIERFTDFVSTKRGLASALHSGDPAYDDLPQHLMDRLEPALQTLLA